MLQILGMLELPVFQNGRDFLQKECTALVPLGHRVPFVDTQQTTAEEPGHSARFDTVCHSNKKTGVAGEIEASEWRRRRS